MDAATEIIRVKMHKFRVGCNSIMTHFKMMMRIAQTIWNALRREKRPKYDARCLGTRM